MPFLKNNKLYLLRRSTKGKVNIAEKNGNWKGDKVGYGGLHTWIRERLPKPKTCEICHRNLPLDLSNKTGVYNRGLKNWEWLCRRCHMERDGRRLCGCPHKKECKLYDMRKL